MTEGSRRDALRQADGRRRAASSSSSAGNALARRAFLAAGAVSLAGCSTLRDADGSTTSDGPTTPPAAPLAIVDVTGPSGATTGISPRPRLEVRVSGGTLTGVAVRPDTSTGDGATDDGSADPPGSAPAKSSAGVDDEVAEATGDLDGTTWVARDPLELGTTYRAVATAENGDGAASTGELVFTVLAEDDAIRAKMMPLHQEVVGVGMPVVLYLTAEVPEDRCAALTDAIVVERPEGIEGAWRWVGDDEVHWRPREYWPAGTEVRVQVPLTQLDLGEGRWGAEDRDITFSVGDAHVSVVDADTHRMTTRVGGEVAREFPVSLGREDSDPAFVTRSGVHLVLSKHADYLMDGATVGLDYETEVKWATRIANSGEFVHGAPWSVPDQGVRNVSHGCVNASDEDARWFYELSRRGDVVEVVGTDRPMELTNGLGDWTLSWEDWVAA